MDYAVTELGQGLRRAIHNVRRTAHIAQIFRHVQG